MTLDPVLREVAARFQSIRSGLDIGFADEAFKSSLHSLRGGVWRSVPAAGEIPFDDAQFEVVVLNGDYLSQELAREANRVLRPDGCMFFSVHKKTGKHPGYTPAEIYKFVREGFDILVLRLPKWWHFGSRGRLMTVCARKKAWREHKDFIREGTLPFTPFRSRT